MKLTISILSFSLWVSTTWATNISNLQSSMNPQLPAGVLSGLNSLISGQVGSLQSSMNSQSPIGTAISLAQATSLFSSQVQPGNTSFPLIQMAEYLIWEIGPPWASTPGWYVGEDYVENPLYDTEMAEYIRGLEDSGGVSTQPQNIVENTLKAGLQKNQAINDIMDAANKQADSTTLQAELNKAYGTSSQTVSSLAVGSTVDNSIMTYTNTFAPVLGATMDGVIASRKASVALDGQLQATYQQINQPQTLLARAAIKNQQELTKTATIQQLSETVNNRTVMKAIDRNQDRVTTNNAQQLDKALGQGVLE